MLLKEGWSFDSYVCGSRISRAGLRNRLYTVLPNYLRHCGPHFVAEVASLAAFSKDFKYVSNKITGDEPEEFLDFEDVVCKHILLPRHWRNHNIRDIDVFSAINKYHQSGYARLNLFALGDPTGSSKIGGSLVMEMGPLNGHSRFDVNDPLLYSSSQSLVKFIDLHTRLEDEVLTVVIPYVFQRLELMKSSHKHYREQICQWP